MSVKGNECVGSEQSMGDQSTKEAGTRWSKEDSWEYCQTGPANNA